MSVTKYQLNGQEFPKNPTLRRFNKEPLFTRGDNVPGYSSMVPFECEFPILEYTEYSFFYSQAATGTHHTLYAPTPDYTSFTTYTGVTMQVFGDQPGYGDYVENVRVTFRIPLDE